MPSTTASHPRRRTADRTRSTNLAEDGGSPGEAEARAWLKAHSNDPLVAGASLPSDHRRDPETGETLDREVAASLSRDPSVNAEGRPHRAEVSYSAAGPSGAWEETMAPDSYVPIVGRGGLTPEQLDKRIRVDRALAQLKPQQRELLRMRFVEQLTLEGIAEETRTSYQAVQQRLGTAVQDFVKAVGDTWLEPYELLREVFG